MWGYILPITDVSPGISSMKHFLSVSPMWKYNAFEKLQKKRAKSNEIYVSILFIFYLTLNWTRHRITSNSYFIFSILPILENKVCSGRYGESKSESYILTYGVIGIHYKCNILSIIINYWLQIVFEEIEIEFK